MTKESETLTMSEIRQQAIEVLGVGSLSEMYDYVCNLERRYLLGQVNSQKPEGEKP